MANEKPLRKIAEAFKELEAAVKSETGEVEVVPISQACSLVSPLFQDGHGAGGDDGHGTDAGDLRLEESNVAARCHEHGDGVHLLLPRLDSCTGRYVYIHDDLPSKFNSDLLKNCRLLTRGTDKPNLCPYFENWGFGPEIENTEGVLANKSWFSTNQFTLEVIFHNKMKQYKCLTKNSSLALAIYVPFYAGLDVSLHLWDSNLTVRDASARDLNGWLSKRPEWKAMWGRNHFLVVGRISWDFRTQTDEVSDWGSKLRFLPESMNMSMLSVEGSSWGNDYAIPYPTNFHPAKDSDVVQ
ncbi:probable xyloglucan galactosyltransferase GT14 [Rosa chinensis]|uniref:probable xyloglucan galactosyltransferase GT14 n=1 Tax=Rosa chinensis TaxID=74649 RepID=UPI001AD94076|nr:probable xyloglucan galactosyltransferase GT14 [Rosa chinensis]